MTESQAHSVDSQDGEIEWQRVITRRLFHLSVFYFSEPMMSEDVLWRFNYRASILYFSFPKRIDGWYRTIEKYFGTGYE